MPFRSEEQRRMMWAKHPDIARRWAREFPGQKNLPLYNSAQKYLQKQKPPAPKD